ncbi:MAG: acyl-CoA dehydrogenase family protein [Solirubrobacterales bacterium]
MFELPGEYAELQEEARALGREIEPIADEVDSLSSLHPRLRRALAASSLSELMFPARFGGRFEEVDPLAICVAREALMPASGNLDSLFGMQGIGTYALTRAGSDAQRAHWIPKVIAVEAIPALAITEPDAGTDLRAITTELRSAGEGLVLDGEKAFITNSPEASFATVLVREGDGYSLVLVPLDRDGVSVAELPPLIAPHVIGDIRFEGVAIEEEDRIGDRGAGFELILATLATFRVSVAGAAVGLAQAALEEAVLHTAERHQFGKPLARLGAVEERLADSWTEIEAARLLAYRAAAAAIEDPRAALGKSSMAKLYATEVCGRVVDRAVQVMGRFGLVRGSKIERYYRQARPMRVYEGASEALRPGIARELVADVQRRRVPSGAGAA